MKMRPLSPAGAVSVGEFSDSGDRRQRHTTGLDHMPTAVRKAEAGSTGEKTLPKVAAKPHAVFLRRVVP